MSLCVVNLSRVQEFRSSEVSAGDIAIGLKAKAYINLHVWFLTIYIIIVIVFLYFKLLYMWQSLHLQPQATIALGGGVGLMSVRKRLSGSTTQTDGQVCNFVKAVPIGALLSAP